MKRGYNLVFLIILSFVVSWLAVTGAFSDERKVAFLGVLTSPADDTVRAQLDLAEGIGLAVVEVSADGPSKDVLRPNDILTRIDGQWLSDNPRHLAVLVRMRKPGDEVEIEFIRKGETRKATVRLGERPWAPLPTPPISTGRIAVPPTMPGWRGLPDPLFREEDTGAEAFRGFFDRFREWLKEAEEEDAPSPPQTRAETRASSTTVITEVVDGRTYRLTITDGQRTFEVRDADGKELFKGSANTREEVQAIPQEYRPAFDRLNSRVSVRRWQSPHRRQEQRFSTPAL